MEKYSGIYVSDIIPENPRVLARQQEILEDKDAEAAVGFARNMLGGERWIEAEEFIKEDPFPAYLYAFYVLGKPWPEAENVIKKNPKGAYKYVNNILGIRWPEAEPYIMKDPESAFSYAKKFIKGRWPEAEPYIAKDVKWALEYTEDIVKGRWPEAEKAFKENHAYWNYYMQVLQKAGQEMDIWESESWD